MISDAPRGGTKAGQLGKIRPEGDVYGPGTKKALFVRTLVRFCGISMRHIVVRSVHTPPGLERECEPDQTVNLTPGWSSGLGYARYGTKQDSIEGALEELNDMLNHYNSLCEMHKEKQWE